MDKLKELMDGLVAEKSLSFEVLEQLRKVKTESDELIKETLLLKEKLQKRDEDYASEMAKRLKQEELVAAWVKRDSELKAREVAVLDIEHKNEIEQLKATHSAKTLTEVKEVVGMVFKNSVLKRNVLGNVPVLGGTNGAYVGQYTKTENEEIIEE